MTLYRLRCIICELLGCYRPSLHLSFIVGGIEISGDNLMARVNTEQTIVVKVTPKTAGGSTVAVDGDARFSVDPASAGSFAQLTPLSATFTPDAAQAVPAAVLINVEADADLDAGPTEIRLITASGALEIVSPEATSLEVQFEAPVDPTIP